MINNDYKFLTFNEQIDKLEKVRGLIITDRDKLLKYLEKYNYENFVNNYCKYLTIDGKKFINGVTSDTLIELFEMDREISNCLFPIISDIERNITTKIVYYMPKIMGKDHPDLLKGNIINIPDREFRGIFPNVIATDKDNNSILLQKENLLKYVPERIKSSNPSLWKISIFWTTGTIYNIYKALKPTIRQEIIKEGITNKYIKYETILSGLLELLNKLRNRICHNNMVYEFEYRSPLSKTKEFIQFIKMISKYNGEVKLYEVSKIIEIIGYPDFTSYIENILIKFKKNLEKSIKDFELADRIYKSIVSSMHFDIN